MKRLFVLLSIMLVIAAPARLFADSDDASSAYPPGKEPFGMLNYRSKYYTDWFSEPFRVEDTAIDNELRFDWQHVEAHGSITNVLTAEIQKSVGIFTFEVQEPYLWNNGVSRGGDGDDAGDDTGNGSSRGLGNLEVAARMPFHQFVSKSGFIDNSIGANLEFGIPLNTIESKNAEITPGVFDDLALGGHVGIQSLFSFSHTFGTLNNAIAPVGTLQSGRQSVGTIAQGRAAFSYAICITYAIEDEEFSIPRVERLIPTFELVGTTTLDGTLSGHNALTGTAGLRAELKPILHGQPSIGVGYVFPIDGGGREQLHWGIITSVTFEF